MKALIEQILTDLETQLQFLTNQVTHPINRTEAAILHCEQALQNLRELVVKTNFQTKQEEIQFFKVTKPKVLAQLQYQVLLYTLESKRPLGSGKIQRKYLEKHLRILNKFMKKYIRFYQYMRGNCTHLDEQYFLRGQTSNRLNLDPNYHRLDSSFNTSHDNMAAQIIANDKFAQYLQSELSALDQPETNPNNLPQKQKSKFSWTDTKVGLIELIYSLHQAGSINKGKADIKELSEFFESTFDIDLGDYYHAFIEIKRRNQPTKFLDLLRQSLLNKVDDELAL